MENEFTKEGIERLMLLVSIGNWVINGIKEKPLEEYDSVEKEIFRMAREKGLNKYFEKDETTGEMLPNRDFEELMFGHVDEYDDYTFWEDLGSRLAARDAANKYGLDALARMDPEERMEKEEEFRQKYEAEFSTNGLDNVEIVKGGG